jgi:hypothetical protein
MRTLILTVPDNDDAENAVRMAAAQLREGLELIVIGRPPEVPKEVLPSMVTRWVAELHAAKV